MTGSASRGAHRGQGGGDRIDAALRALGEPPVDLPPLSAALEAELDGLAPVRPRAPRRAAALAAAVSIGYAAALTAALSVRPDIAGLPVWWLVAFGAAWLASFGALSWLALVPPRGQVMPRWRRAGAAALIASAGFVLAGLVLDQHAPGVSVVLPPGVSGLIEHGGSCIRWGLITAAVPVALCALLARGTVPVGARWIGAAIGAAGGSLGGFMLHMHCHIADPLHLGFIHGGVVAVAAALGALIIPRAVR